MRYAMAQMNMKISVKRAWWLTPYFYGLATVAAITGREPDWGKVGRMIDRGITAKVTWTSGPIA